jgi:hypothetical protein
MSMPPFPTQPDRDDWWTAAMILRDRADWHATSSVRSDPLGYLSALARDLTRTRHARTPAYQAFLAAQDAGRRAVAAAEDAERARRNAAASAKERAEEAAFHAAGGTALEWAIHQEATEQAKADNAKKRATSRMRAKARTTPRRKCASLTT